jgi:hypothetical protein
MQLMKLDKPLVCVFPLLRVWRPKHIATTAAEVLLLPRVACQLHKPIMLFNKVIPRGPMFVEFSLLQGVALALGASKQPLPDHIPMLAAAMLLLRRTAHNLYMPLMQSSHLTKPRFDVCALLQGVALALGASKQPLPAYRAGAYHAAAASTSVGRYVDISTHTGLIAQMSPVSEVLRIFPSVLMAV